MASPILMPKAGQSMTEGRIVTWLKKEGEAVKRGDPLLEIETDKANLEVEALDAGVLRKVFHEAGEVVPVLAVIGVIGGEGEKIDLEEIRKAAPAEEVSPASTGSVPGKVQTSPSPVVVPPAPTVTRVETRVLSPESAVATTTTGDGHHRTDGGHHRAMASPLARRVATERGVRLEQVRGTGPGGRILRRDVESAPSTPQRAAGAGLAAPGLPHGLSYGAPFRAPREPYPPPSPRPPARVPVEGMRKAIGTALQQSKQLIPHFYATVSIDLGNALELKRAREADGLKLSVNDLIARASALALSDEPRVNCRVFPDRIEYPSDVNIGIAVGSEEGLLVPVVLRAEERDLAGIAAECRRVIEAATSGKLIGAGQGTFTISNLGMFGVESFTAIINPPEGAILAVGAIRTELVPAGGGFFPRPIMKVTLSSDHRAIDGVLAARFLGRLRQLLQEADRM